MLFSKSKLIFILILIGLLAYAPSLNNKFVWDDEQFIYNNVYVKNFDIKNIFSKNTIAGAGENSTYYRPLTTFTFALDYKLWQLNPFGFHLTNTILHILVGIILFLFLTNLGISKNKSFFISAIFLTHPLQTEAVVYANSRGDSMYALWSMLGLFTFLFLCKKKEKKILLYDTVFTINTVHLAILTSVFYFLSILSKEIGLASLGLFFITFLAVNYKKLINKKNITKVIKNNYLQLATLLSLVMTAIFYLIARNKILNIPTNINVYKVDSLYGSSIYVRLHTFTKAIWTYIGLIFAPLSLHMERSLEIITEPISIWLIITIILFVMMVIFGYLEFKKRKTLFIWFGFSWFIIMLIPVSGIVPINGLIYEHWLYMPIIGFVVAIMGLLTLILKNKFNRILKYLLPIILLIYIVLTIKQNYIWKDLIKFYNYTLKFNQTARLMNNLAMSYADIGQNQKAVETYKKSIKIADYYPQTYYNLGNAYLALEKVDLAEESFKTAIRINNRFFPSYAPLINILIQKEQYYEALPLLEELVRNNPKNLQLNLVYLSLLYKLNESSLKIEKQILNLKTLFGNNKQALYLINTLINNNTKN